ncbi:MAG: 16S rRNA (guanine(527)-N(7))-methyltransferase RsmG [Planctomycetota bacterium]
MEPQANDGSEPVSQDSLVEAIARYEVKLPPDQVDRLDHYCRLLWEWNEKINLTRHTDYERFVARDLVDALSFARFLERRERVLDVGSGGGVPGVVLAIVRSDLRLALSESVGKKARVLQDIVARLELSTPVHHARAEDLLREKRFDSLVVRAVAPLRKLLDWFQPYWGQFGRMLVMKGPAWSEERGEARHHGLMRDLALRKLDEYPLPGTDSKSVLLQICPKSQLDRYAQADKADE